MITLSETSEKINSLFTVTDKFSKYIHLISDWKNYSAETWADLFFDHIFWFWELPEKIISDWDFKFIRVFWQNLFRKCKITLEMTAVYHLAADEQAERINQTVKTALHCLIVSNYKKIWKSLLSKVEYTLNIISNVFSDIILFELLYSVRAQFMLIFLAVDSKKDNDFFKKWEQLRLEMINTLMLTKTKMTVYFNQHHWSVKLKNQIYIKIVWEMNHEYKILRSLSLFIKKIESFKILKKIDHLIYHLNLSLFMKIHSVILIVHLEQACFDSFQWEIPSASSILMKSEKHWVVKKILAKQNQDWKDIFYQIKWKNY